MSFLVSSCCLGPPSYGPPKQRHDLSQTGAVANHLKTHRTSMIWGCQGRLSLLDLSSVERAWGPLGPIWGLSSGLLRGPQGQYWTPPEPVLGLSWGPLGALLGLLEPSWGDPGTRGPAWSDLEGLLGRLERLKTEQASMPKSHRRLKEINCFCFLGASWGPS